MQRRKGSRLASGQLQPNQTPSRYLTARIQSFDIITNILRSGAVDAKAISSQTHPLKSVAQTACLHRQASLL